MTLKRAVVAEGTESPELPPRPPTPRWLWVIVALALAGVGAVLLAVSGSEPPASTIDPALERPEAPIVGVRDHVPGFPDDVVVVVSGEDHKLWQLRWPARGRPVQTPVAAPFNARISYDRSGEWLATTSKLTTDELLLTVGKGPTAWLEEPDALGFVWHDSIPGRLAWTTWQRETGQWELQWADAAQQPKVVMTQRGAAGGLAGFGEWGFAVATGSEVVVYNAQGELWQSIRGRFLGSYPQGLIVMGVRLELVDLMGTRIDLDIAVKHLEPTAAVVSPDWTKLAVLGTKGVKVAPILGDGEVTEMFTSTPSPHVVWSSDSRFVLVPTPRGVAVIDTEEGGKPVKLLESKIVLGVGVSPRSP